MRIVKINKQRIVFAVSVLSLSFINAITAFATSWQWMDRNSDGIAECYCFDEDGSITKSGTTPDGYMVNTEGQWVENDVVQTKTIPLEYQSIIEYTKKYVNEEVDFDDPYYSYFEQYLPTDPPRIYNFGYCLKDIDADGIDELILTALYENSSEDPYIYAIVTLQDGKPITILSRGGQRNGYYLCQNGIISNEGSSGADYTSYSYYKLVNKSMQLIDEVYTHPTDYDHRIGWYYSTSMKTAEEQVDTSTAQKIIDGHVHQKLIITDIKRN